MKTIHVVGALALMFQFTSAAGSTFVGNGGSAGDVELAVTLKQLREVFEIMAGHEEPVCACPKELEGRAICEPLKELSSHEARFCSEVSREKAKDVLKTLSDTNVLQVKWTHEPIDVVEAGRSRAADAVASPAERTVTINLDRFLEMKPYERIFLLSHELIHFTRYQNKPITDEGSIGEFSGPEGGRRLVNAMASTATVIASNHSPILTKYRAKLLRPQGWRKAWIDLDLGVAKAVNPPDSTYAMDQQTVGQINFRYYLISNFGPMISFRAQNASKSIGSRISATEDINALGAGVAARFFLFQDPLSYMGQSHLAIYALAEKLTAKYRVKDDYTSASETQSVWGGNFGVDYYFPVIAGFWATAGVNYTVSSVRYSTFNLNDGNNFFAHVGASYAF